MGRLFLPDNSTYLRRLNPICFLLLLFLPGWLNAQGSTDSVPSTPAVIQQAQVIVRDSPAIKQQAPDSIQHSLPSVSPRPAIIMAPWQLTPGLPFRQQIMQHHPYFAFNRKAFVVPGSIRNHSNKDTLFYVISGLLFLFAILKMSFSKYFNDLFRVFFRTTMKQRQIREQLMQTPLPSLMFNFFFVISAGLYINFLFQRYAFRPEQSFWIRYGWCCAGLAIIYLAKFIVLKFCGWLFNIPGAADSYIFIVFIINKMIGIFLLPVIVLMAFTGEPVFTIIMVLSWCGIGMLVLYRFILAFSAVRNEVRFSLFHFILYLVAFEIAPLFLIYRVLLSFI